MFISRKKFEEDLCKARREECDRWATYEERRRLGEEQRELERSMRGEIEELRRQLHGQKKEIYQAIDCVDRRLARAEKRMNKPAPPIRQNCYRGRHEKRE